MTDIQEKVHTAPVLVDQEKTIDTEHREVATSGSDVDGDQPDHSDHFHTTPWTWKDRVAALSLSGLYVGKRSPSAFHAHSSSFGY